MKDDKHTTLSQDHCQAGGLSCKLTTTELKNRKATIIAGLKARVTGRKELANGYAFRFAGSDELLDNLVGFIKTERACCDFFSFGLSVSGDKSEAWLTLTGPAGAKDFILTELEF